jgi:BirA family transcriptional regulator, biotin operon repressor / biotin---[acetyl-CoA-carboxylase] ligase
MDDLKAFRSPASVIGCNVVVNESTGSTNDDARILAGKGAPHGTLVLANTQTSGRGRRGRVWNSPPHDNLYASFVLRPKLKPTDAPSLSLVAGLAVAEAVAPWCPGVDVRVKWPNDVRANQRKLAGVLVEASLNSDGLLWVVLGIGMNVRGVSVPEELESIATTLRVLRGGEDVSRTDVLGALCVRLEQRLEECVQGGFAAIHSALAARCETLGQYVRIDEFDGMAEALGTDGALMVRTRDGVLVAVRNGEVAG